MRLGAPTLALLLGLLLPSEATAYIIVLRNGSYVDVGEAYRLNGSRLEYKAPDGSTRIIPFDAIDFPGTAMMNGESSDDFFDRASKSLIRSELPSPPPPPPPTATRPRRTEPEPVVTITNATLEPYRVERERADAEFRRQHPEAAREIDAARRAAAAAAAAADEALYAPDPIPSDARYEAWAAQARILRDQLDSEEAQIEAITAELQSRDQNPLDYRQSYKYNYGRAPVIADPYGYYDPYVYGNPRADDEYAQLSSRLIDLQVRHEATLVRWENFLERARRAGVPPGIVLEY